MCVYTGPVFNTFLVQRSRIDADVGLLRNDRAVFSKPQIDGFVDNQRGPGVLVAWLAINSVMRISGPQGQCSNATMDATSTGNIDIPVGDPFRP